MFYSASTGGFYATEIHGDNMPADVMEITEKEHADLLSGQANGYKIECRDDGFPILTDPHPPSLNDLCASIDSAADAARSKVAGDALRAVEYEIAAAEAQAFKDAGYPDTAVPRTVSAWAINGRTARQAADSILAEATAYNEALYQIRETRLGAKEQVRQAMAADHGQQACLIASTTIDSIHAMITGIGNAGA